MAKKKFNSENETDLEVEIILMDQDRPIDDLIERLLRNCLCK